MTGPNTEDFGSLIDRFKAEISSPLRRTPYVRQPFPTPMDETILALIRWFLGANLQQRLHFIRAFDPTQRESQVLLAFAERMATRSVREGDILPAEAGLIAALLEGERYDSRETTIALTLLHDALDKVRVDPRDMFARVANLAPEVSISALIRDFLQRAPEDITIEAMGYRMAMSPQGVTYEPDPSVWDP